MNQKPYLKVYTEHIDTEMPNSIVENVSCLFVFWRKNWSFCDIAKGVETSAMVFSLVETSKTNQSDAYFYLLTWLNGIHFIGKNPDNTIGSVKIYAQNCLQALR